MKLFKISRNCTDHFGSAAHFPLVDVPESPLSHSLSGDAMVVCSFVLCVL